MADVKPRRTQTEWKRCSANTGYALPHVGVAPKCWFLRTAHWRQSMIIYVCRFKGEETPQYSCRNRSMMEDNGVSPYKTSVVANSTDKIYNKHARVPQSPPMSSCSMLVSSDIFGGR